MIGNRKGFGGYILLAITHYFPLLILLVLFTFPILVTVTNSFMCKNEILEAYSIIPDQFTLFRIIPEKISLEAYYQMLFRNSKYLIYFWNSIIITLPIVLGQITISAFAAFSFAKIRFPCREVIFFVYIVVMMLPFQVTLLPNYISLKALNLYDTYLAVILPGVFTTFGVFLLRQFMVYIDDAYIEAAKIDGANIIQIMFCIIFPQCKAAIAALAILAFVDNWNMIEQPLILLKDQSMYPMSIFLANSSDLTYAFGILFIFPPVMLFLYGKEYLVEGIKMSVLK